MNASLKFGLISIFSILPTSIVFAGSACHIHNQRTGEIPKCVSHNNQAVILDISANKNHIKLKDDQSIAFQLSDYKYARPHSVSEWHTVNTKKGAHNLSHKNAKTLYVLNCAILDKKGKFIKDISCDKNLKIQIKK